MHIDPFTTLIFNIIASFLMSAGLFIVSQSYLTDVKGIRRWATALLLLGIGWLLTILFGVIPNFFSQVIGSTFVLLGLAFYFHALVRFKAICVSVQWAYLVVILGFIGNFYFVEIDAVLNHKIATFSLCSTILLFANSILSFSKQQNIRPKSHVLTGSIFVFCAAILLVRTIYYEFWNTQLEQTPLHLNVIQSITYLGAAITVFGTSFGFVLMCNDKYIAEKNQAQLAAQEALDRLQKIAHHVPGVVFQFNLSATGQFSMPYSNDGIQTIFRLSPEQVREDANPIFDRIYTDDYHDFIHSIHQSAHDLTLWSREFRVQFEDGSIHWLEGNAAPQRHQDASILWHGFVSDITERKQAEEIIKQLAFYDPLTQLPNRRLLYERLKHSIELSHRTGKPMAVLMMDLDEFKAVNDNLGHAAGDELLQQVAIRIKARLREMDTVARLGGDEFVIILEDINHLEDIAHVANEIIVTLSQPFTLSQNHEVTIGVSIGIGICPQHGNSVEVLMDNADIALYRAKDSGRGCFSYFSEVVTKK